MSGNFRPTKIPNMIWLPESSFHFRLVGITECAPGVSRFSCLCYLGGGPGSELIPHPGMTSTSYVVKKSMYVIHRLSPSPDKLWFCKARAAWDEKKANCVCIFDKCVAHRISNKLVLKNNLKVCVKNFWKFTFMVIWKEINYISEFLPIPIFHTRLQIELKVK